MSEYFCNERVMTPPSTSGWIEITLNDEAYDRVETYIKKSQEKPHSIKGGLAGNLSYSHSLEDEDDWFFNNVLQYCIKQYMDSFPPLREVTYHLHRNPIGDVSSEHFELSSFWVNYQQKHEFNPIHDHSGIFSFVLWNNIPYKYVDEISQEFLGGCSRPEPACFKFTYLSLLGELENYHYCHEDDMNKKLVFFPSRLRHSVNPFYSTDEVRVSVSGNIDFKK